MSLFGGIVARCEVSEKHQATVAEFGRVVYGFGMQLEQHV